MWTTNPWNSSLGSAALVSHRAAQLVALLSAAWFVLWLLVGGTSGGKAWYEKSLSRSAFGAQYKAGLPLLTVAAPLWTAAGAALLLGRSTAAAALAVRVRSFDRLALVWIVAPFGVFVAASVARHVRQEKTLDDRIMEAGNAFGYAALIAMNVLLVPVARHSALLKVAGWNPAAAVRIHVVTGRMIVLLAWVHGAVHLYRFAYTVRYASPLLALVPPPYCLTPNPSGEGGDAIPGCDDGASECSCYKRWRNFTGIVAGAALGVVLISSLGPVRRRAYSLFYRVHVLAGPTVLAATVLHWDRGLLYCCGGILYYLASSLALVLESRASPPAAVAGVERLPSSAGRRGDDRSCVSLTLVASEAAVAQYPVGGYVRARSAGGGCCGGGSLSHPFTANLVPRHPGMLRLLFRVTGRGTSRLASSAGGGAGGGSGICVEGYQLASPKFPERHDLIVIVAGGIGITPYLTLLHELAAASASGAPPTGQHPQRVVLHWVCRDPSLIEFVRREYFDTLPPVGGASSSSAGAWMRIVVHSTAQGEGRVASTDLPPPREGFEPESDADATATAPFAPLALAPLQPTLRRAAALLLAPFAAAVVPAAVAIWHVYRRVQDPKSVPSRVWNAGIVVAWPAAVAVAANLLVRLHRARNPSVEFAPIKRTVSDEEDPDGDGNDDEDHFEMIAGVAASDRTKPGPLGPSDDDDGRHGGSSLQADAASSASASLGPRRVPVVVLQGRPSSIRRLLEESVNGDDDDGGAPATFRRPAVYCCGPESLMRDVRSATRKPLCRSTAAAGAAPGFALYEESFEL